MKRYTGYDEKGNPQSQEAYMGNAPAWLLAFIGFLVGLLILLIMS